MSLVNVTVTDTHLVVSPNGINKLWGLTGEMSFPLVNVTNVSIGEASLHRKKGMRAPGLGWFNRWVGTFRKPDSKAYWCAEAGPTLEVGLTGEKFDHLILSPENPQELAAQIDRAVNKWV